MGNKLKYPEAANVRFEEKHRKHVLEAVKGNQYKNEMKTRRRSSSMKKLAYTSVTAAALVILFIGSSYISPGIAKVAAKIPYLSLFVKQEEYKYAISDVISDAANDKGYKLVTFDVSVPEKELTLGVSGTKEDFNKIKDDIEKNINAALQANNLGKFDIEVKRHIERQIDYVETPEDKKYTKDSQELEKKILEQLKINNYETAFPIQVRINKIEKFIYVAVPNTEKRIDELKNLLHSTSKEYGDNFRLRVTRIDMKAREQEIRWGKNNIISTIGGGLMENKELKVKTYSYSFHPYPLQLKIKTTIDATDPAAKELAVTIEKEIKDFILTDEITKEVRNDPYNLIIYSKDKKKIN
ncbi:DUF4030 domain-containing protein [Bacillus sp. T33-2]|uniref:DUF4030 domain-containing protein n=1 Tax=Bacillus sp. T33-2 TaxID=2054168 RepID=UPI000C782D06|nr:DUF4030 domain-containing protein [Bacillus sp. T33-2]PLR89854.1 hypothetical protein CVD19_23125 [Bacillus sp. T33-2]